MIGISAAMPESSDEMKDAWLDLDPGERQRIRKLALSGTSAEDEDQKLVLWYANRILKWSPAFLLSQLIIVFSGFLAVFYLIGEDSAEAWWSSAVMTLAISPIFIVVTGVMAWQARRARRVNTD